MGLRALSAPPTSRLRRRIRAMSEFVTVAQIEDIPPGDGRTVEVHGIRIALFNVAGHFYAVDNTCPHAGGPLGEGHLEGHIVELSLIHISEPTRQAEISYAVFCLKKKKK